MPGNYFTIVFLLFGVGLQETYCQTQHQVSPFVIMLWIYFQLTTCINLKKNSLHLQYKLAGKCRAPDKAPLNLEIIISICQEEIKSALLQGKFLLLI